MGRDGERHEVVLGDTTELEHQEIWADMVIWHCILNEILDE